MKTGKTAKLFGIDPKTVTAWVDEFAEFFSEKARRGDGTQRDYLPEDLIVLNTIKTERASRAEIETIRAKLRTGYRDTVLPPESIHMDKDNALVVYGQLKALEAQLDIVNRDNDQLREELKQDRETIARLNQEIGKWRALYEMLKEQQDDDE
jgi:DNA-binding transcriptional MerR regulator